MAQLRPTSAETSARAALSLFELDDLARFRLELPARVRELIDCEHSSYNEFGPNPGEIFFVADPLPDQPKEMREAFDAFAMQNPLAAHCFSTGYPGTLRLSDFVSRRELHALELYEHVYRHIDVEYQLAFTLPSDGQLIGVTVSRAGRDFSDGELAPFEAMRAIMASAYRNAHDRAQLDVVLRGLDVGGDGPAAIVLVEASGLLAPAHERAERLLEELAVADGTLALLRDWARRRRAIGQTASSRPLTIPVNGSELSARYVHGKPGSLDAIVLRRTPIADPQTLRVLGLTPRQCDVLHLLWRGMTNAQIAGTLVISEHTVRHHLEETYRRLSVSSRFAAAQRAGRVFAGEGAAEA